MRQIPGIFQNIHDSFDEIDSKTLNNVYRKSTQPPRDKSGEFLSINEEGLEGGRTYSLNWKDKDLFYYSFLELVFFYLPNQSYAPWNLGIEIFQFAKKTWEL